MHVFVTGGSGFLGRNLIPALVAAGHSVRALARTEAAASTIRLMGATPAPGELDDVAALRQGMASCQWVFHLAASTEEWAPTARFNRINVEGHAT